MHVLIIGAAGMIGRKLTERLDAKASSPGGRSPRSPSLTSRRRKSPPASAARCRSRPRHCRSGAAIAPHVAARPDIIFHLAAVVSGEAEADFDKGYRDQSRRHALPVRGDPQRAEDGYKPRLVFTSSIAVFGAPFPPPIGDEFFIDAAHQLRHAEGDRRAAPCRLYAPRLLRRHQHPPADHLHPAGQAQQGGFGLLLQHHARAAGRPGSGAAGVRDVRHWHASPRAAVGFLLHAATIDGASSGRAAT